MQKISITNVFVTKMWIGINEFKHQTRLVNKSNNSIKRLNANVKALKTNFQVIPAYLWFYEYICEDCGQVFILSSTVKGTIKIHSQRSES